MNQHFPRRTLCSAAVAIALAGITASTHASEDTPAQVVVTAQSRSQQAQQVPIAMQVLSGDALKDQGITDLSEADAFIPGLAIESGQATRPQIFLRGIGTLDFGVGTDSPVGIYTDGVYTGKTGGSTLNFLDVKRIEVLKGPQGTLFGRNAAAGAIAIISNEPVGRTEAQALLRVGEDGLHHEEVLYNTPLNESWAVRLAATNHHSGGWIGNQATGRRMGREDDWGTRLALRWQNDATRAVFSWEHEKLDASGPVVASLTGGKVNFGGPAVWTDPYKTSFSSDASPNFQARTFDGVTLRVEHQLPFAMLTSTTAYRHFRSGHSQDSDGAANPASYLATGNRETNTTWQQEFRLNGQRGALDWVAGISAFREQNSQLTDATFTTTSLDTIIKANAGLAPYATLTALAQGIGKATNNPALLGTNLLGLPWYEGIQDKGRSRAYAVYGDTIWHLANEVNLTVGGRYTHDQKSFSWFSPARNAPGLDTQLNALKQAQFFPTAVALKLLTPQQAVLLQGVTATNLAFTNTAAAKAPFTAEHSWNNFSPRVVLDKHLSPATMVFASWSRGYQAGGFDTVGVNGRYEAEKVSNIETGIKGSLRGNSISYSASVFHYEFTNLQSLTLVPASLPSGIPAYQIASSDQKASGADLEGQWQLGGGWRVQGAAEYINQTYDVYTAPTGVNLTGQAAGTPFWSAAAALSRKWPLLQGNADFSLRYGFSGERRCNSDTSKAGTCLQGTPVGAGDARERVDLRLGWEAPSRRWSIAFIVNNLTDKQYVSVSTLGAVVGSPYAYLTRPRSAAVEMRFKL